MKGSEECKHHWMVDTPQPDKDDLDAYCKKCGAKTRLPKYIVYSGFNNKHRYGKNSKILSRDGGEIFSMDNTDDIEKIKGEFAKELDE